MYFLQYKDVAPKILSLSLMEAKFKMVRKQTCVIAKGKIDSWDPRKFKVEFVVAAILLSCMEVSYCTSKIL